MASASTIDIGGLLSGGRQTMVVNQRVALEPFEGVTFPDPAQVRLAMHAVGKVLEIDGTIDVEARGDCNRCLENVVLQMHVDVEERLEPTGSDRRDPFDENNVLSGERLDVADLVTQLVCSAMPMGILCRVECRGLCTVCGENRNAGACNCGPGNGDE